MARTENAGTVYFKVTGTQYDVRGSVKIGFGGPQRTPIMNVDGSLAGYSTKYVHSTMDLEITDSGGLSLAQMQAISGTATALLGNGKNYILANVFNLDPPDLDCIEGKVPWKLCGDISEITSRT